MTVKIIIKEPWEIVDCWACGRQMTYGDTGYRNDNGPIHCCEYCAGKTAKRNDKENRK